MVYSVSVVNYSSTHADDLTVITETERSLRTSGELTATTGVRIEHGRAVNLTGSTAATRLSRSSSSTGICTPSSARRCLPIRRRRRRCDARFQESLQFPDENGGFADSSACSARTAHGRPWWQALRNARRAVGPCPCGSSRAAQTFK